MVFVISFLLLPALITTFSIGTEKAIYFSVFSPKQLKCFSTSSANSFIDNLQNDNHS